MRELTVAVMSALHLQRRQRPSQRLFAHSHIAVVFSAAFTAMRRGILPYDTHAAFNPSILFSV